MDDAHNAYAARLEVDYPATLDRLTTVFRPFVIIPIAIILGLIVGGLRVEVVACENGTEGRNATVASGLFLAILLMLLFRQRYPRWWFDFLLELSRFSARVTAYALLLTDRYPSTEDAQSIHLELDYPDAARLNRWLPLVKWFLALPHYVILAFLWVAVGVVTVVAWFAIVFTGRYPRALFDFVVGVGRWSLRVQAYAFLLLTDDYPPFSLEKTGTTPTPEYP